MADLSYIILLTAFLMAEATIYKLSYELKKKDEVTAEDIIAEANKLVARILKGDK